MNKDSFKSKRNLIKIESFGFKDVLSFREATAYMDVLQYVPFLISRE